MATNNNSFPLSQKYIDFINTVDNVRVDFLEGTTASGKTTVGAGVKFMRMVSRSSRMQHIIASKTTGTAEKNILNQDNGILKIHKGAAVYYGNGDATDRIPHIKFEGKTIYVLGYDNKDKWENVLGSQFGCVYIDEINTADMEFIREVSHRNEYLMATLNPDDPTLPVYEEYINRSRPYKKYADDVPAEIMEELLAAPATQGWRYWFFTFRDNLSLSEADIQRKVDSVPAGTKMYKNKIQGLRGRSTGLVFSNFDRKKHVVSVKEAKKLVRDPSNRHQTEWFQFFSAGLDTSYSQVSPDTIAMSFIGITNRGRLFLLSEKVYNNAKLGVPLAPSDTVRNYIDFLDNCRREWGFARDVFIDSADAATIMEFAKHKRNYGSVYNFTPAYKKEKVIDRINNQLGWFADSGSAPCFYIVETCVEYIGELGRYGWKEDRNNEPEDRNDHMVNSVQYAWLPYEKKIGIGRSG